MLPEQIGRYRILAPLGKGAIGEVYKALDPELGREVAIKVISRSEVDTSNELRRRFRREVQLAAHLKHPNIITLFDVGLESQPPFVVTELLAGGTLSDYLKQGPIPWAEALILLKPIGDALSYAHEAGIIHRDVKPSNIMFADDTNRTIKLADFGLALRQEDEHLTQSGGIVGTIAYMSPEQANGEAVDPRTDIFSFGLILFEAISGYNPLRGETVSRTLLRAISYEPIDLSDVQNQAPEQVITLLERAVARERQHRYSSCKELSEDISSCLALLELSSGVPAAHEPESQIKVEKTAPAVHIENAGGIDLPPDAREILQGMFSNYWRVSIREELPGGFSGSRVYVVVPVRKDHSPELPTVVKMAPLRLIEQEWHAYQSYVRDQLSGITQVTGEPVFPTGASWGGLRYKLVGSGAIDFDSLSQAYHKVDVDELRFMLEERLFKRLAALWRFNFPTPAFHLAASYDHLLPINLLIRPGGTKTDATIPVIRAGEVGVPRLSRGDSVRLSGFVVSEVDSSQNYITLDWRSEQKVSPGSFRVRIQPVTKLQGIQVDLVIDNLDGVVVQTRQDLMRAHVLEVMGWDFDTEQKMISLTGGRELPNPLIHLPRLLGITPNVRLANIHGDLNPENILVDCETKDVRLIDFATARRDHVLHDFLRLETGIITRLLPATLKAAGLPPEIIFQFYTQLHCHTFSRPGQSSFEPEQNALEKPFSILAALRSAARSYFYDPNEWAEYYQGLILYLMGSLKYKNLESLGKKNAFYGAASALHFLDKPPPCQELKSQRRPVPAIQNHVPHKASIPASSLNKESVLHDIEPLPGPMIRKVPKRGPAFSAWLRENWVPTILIGTLLLILFGLLLYSSDLLPPDATTTVSISSEVTIEEYPTLTRPVVATATSSRASRSSPMPISPKTVSFADISRQEAIVAILLDTSASMNVQGKLTNSLTGITGLMGNLDPDDEVSVYILGGQMLKLEPSGRVDDVREDLIAVVSGLFAEGQPHLYEALCVAVDDLVKRNEALVQTSDEILYGLIVLTDAKESGTDSAITEEEVLTCLNQGRQQLNLKLILLTFDAEEGNGYLEKLVDGNSDQVFHVRPEDIIEKLSTISFDP